MDKLNELYGNVFPFWSGLSSADREKLIDSSATVRFAKGANVHSGNECTGIIIIKSGCLRLYLLSDDGKEITLERLYAGEICVFSASCALETVTFDVLVDAEEDSECVIVGGCAYAEVAERVPEVKIFTLEAALERISDAMWIIRQILFMSMDRRLAIFLLDESSKTASDTLRLTHEQIAKYMGSAREVVSRMLKYFAKEGIVSSSRTEGIKILDKKRLRALTS